MDRQKLEAIKRINREIVHEDGTVDTFAEQLLNLSGGIFDTSHPLVAATDSKCISYFEPDVERPIIMRVNTAIKLREKHDIGYAFVGQCVKMLKESVLAFDSMQHESSKIVLLDEKSEDGDPFISICRMDKTVHSIEVNEITSIYDKQNFENFLIRSYEADKCFYKNEKTEQYIKSQRLQLPRGMMFALSCEYSNSSFTKSQVESILKDSELSENGKISVYIEKEYLLLKNTEVGISAIKVPQGTVIDGNDLSGGWFFQSNDEITDYGEKIEIVVLKGKRTWDILNTEGKRWIEEGL